VAHSSSGAFGLFDLCGPHRAAPGFAPDHVQHGDRLRLQVERPHKTPAIRDWLTKHPRFTLQFTPTGSSWINQNDVREWIATWNADPRPFAWTKTAEEILATPSTNISRISGAGH
jgi:hypothetical protein